MFFTILAAICILKVHVWYENGMESGNETRPAYALFEGGVLQGEVGGKTGHCI